MRKCIVMCLIVVLFAVPVFADESREYDINIAYLPPKTVELYEGFGDHCLHKETIETASGIGIEYRKFKYKWSPFSFMDIGSEGSVHIDISGAQKAQETGDSLAWFAISGTVAPSFRFKIGSKNELVFAPGLKLYWDIPNLLSLTVGGNVHAGYRLFFADWGGLRMGANLGADFSFYGLRTLMLPFPLIFWDDNVPETIGFRVYAGICINF